MTVTGMEKRDEEDDDGDVIQTHIHARYSHGMCTASTNNSARHKESENRAVNRVDIEKKKCIYIPE